MKLLSKVTFNLRLAAACLLTTTALGMVAPASAASKAEVDRITAAVNESLGGSGIKVLSVTDLEVIGGLFEVVVSHNGSKKIIYTNASGSHLILGELLEAKSMTNLTEARMDKLNAINFDKDLPVKLALKTVYGTGSRKIAVFEDPNCGYCKRFRKEALTKLQDTTVYTFVFPVLGRDSLDKAQKVMCADNKSKMWDDWMLNDQSPTGKGDCNPPINELITLGRGMGVTGTPTVFFQDGTRASGAIPAAELNRRVAAAARAK
ncbi:DsbC family protein [Limnobacter sp.]|uniref:DsbC family protein n=1 Tax=Limnobacter sp. TaxID=2003368 RepID=UPI0035157FAB